MARICVIRQFYFPLDTRVRREVDALANDGHDVEVVCMRRPGEPRREQADNVSIRRLPIHHKRGGVLRYLLEYLTFPIMAATVVAGLAMRRRFDVVQVNTIPDTLVFAALVPKLLGSRVLIDLHECMPEFFATKFGTSMNHAGVRTMARLEQASIRFADFAITCTEEMRETFVARGAKRDGVAVVMNSADEAIFDVRRHSPRPRDPTRFELVCHGSLEERYGVDTAIRAVARLRDVIPELRLRIYGEGSYRDDLRRLAGELGLDDEVVFSDGFVPIGELVGALASSDAGIVAMKRDAFRDLTHCNKMFDLISLRRPVLCSRTRSVKAHFPDACFAYFDSDDDEDLARAIRELHDDPARAEQMVEQAATVNEPFRWPHQRERYLSVVSALAQGHSPDPG